MKPFVKDPDATLDYLWDWTHWLEGDTIDSYEVFSAVGINKIFDSNTPSTVKVWLGGGTIGALYCITCRIVTDGGRINDKTISVLVRSQ